MNSRQRSVLRLPALTTDPTLGDGSLWYRSDTGQIKGQFGGSATVLATSAQANYPLGAHPRSGTWFSSPAFAAGLGTYVVPLGSVTYTPLVLNRAATIDQIAVNVGTASAGSSIRIGCYAPKADMSPGPLITDWGTINTAVVGVAPIITLSPVLNLPAGVYWTGVAAPATGATPRITSANSGSSPYVSQFAGEALSASAVAYVQTGNDGTLPALAAPIATGGDAVFVKFHVQ